MIAAESEGIDAILARLVNRCRATADDLLDIKLNTARGESAGACVNCFYRVCQKLPSHTTPELSELRYWLEELIEVVAYDEDGEARYRMPLRMDYSDLETCCRAYMKAAADAIEEGNLVLEFDYCRKAA